jgi:hypothetical protein
MLRFLPTASWQHRAPSRRTVFVRGTSAEQRESPEIAGRNTKANVFCKGGARYQAATDLNKTRHHDNVSSCVKSAGPIFFKATR